MSTSKDGVAPNAFGQRNKRLLETGDYFDFVIECGSRQFKVHRSIICPQSSFLEKLCVSKFKEGIGGQASLMEANPSVFEKALDFLYTGTYDDGTLITSAGTIPTQQARSLPSAMMQQDIESIPDISSSEIIDTKSIEDRLNGLRTCEGSALLLHVQLYHLAEYLQARNLKQEAFKRCTKLLKERFNATSFVDGIKEALTNVNELDLELRAQVIRSCIENKRTVANCPAIEELLMEFEPIAWTVLKERDTKYEENQENEAQNFDELLKESDVLKGVLGIMKNRISTLTDEIDLAYRLVRDHDKCRNCSQEFGAYLDKDINGKIDLLRCSKCRCRHSPHY